MNHHLCIHGRAIVASMAAMNLRAVIGSVEISYVAVVPRAVVHTATYQPRDEKGRFVAYCTLIDYSYESANDTADEFKIAYWLDAIEDEILFEDD